VPEKILDETMAGAALSLLSCIGSGLEHAFVKCDLKGM